MNKLFSSHSHPASYERKSHYDDGGDLASIAQMLQAQGDAFEEFKNKTVGQVDELDRLVREGLIKAGRPNLASPGQPGAAVTKASQTWIDTKTHRPVPVLAREQSLAELGGQSKGDTPSIGRVLRGIVLGGLAHDAKALEDERKAMGITPDPSGGYTVPSALSDMWIDLLRAEMVLTQAGAMTVPMETSTLSLAKLTGDPAVSWRQENAPLTASDPTFGAVTLSAKTVACLVKLSLELSQDSGNIDLMIQRSLTQAMAGAIDRAGLVGVTVNAGAAPEGVFGLAGRNRVTSIGAPTSATGWNFAVDGMYELMLDNIPMTSIGALIGHPALWRCMAKIKDSNANPLTVPAEVAQLRKLWTTTAPLDGSTAQAVIGDWRDLLFGVRKNIEVKVLQEAFMGSNLQVAVLAYARVDFAATREASFCTLEDITVS